MIELPRRSVTRFFIPLIDVLTLLFCIYLLMPIVKESPDDDGEASSTPLTREERAELERLRRQARAAGASADLIAAERQDLARLRQDKAKVLQERLAVRMLYIDPDSGKLFTYDQGDPVEIKTEAEAHALIRRHRQEAGSRELYYVFQLPRRVTGFPKIGQVDLYVSWFKDVAHAIDNPFAAP